MMMMIYSRTMAYRLLQENSLGAELRNLKGQALVNGRQPGRKQFLDSTSLSDSKSTEASTSLTMDDFGAADLPSTSRPAEVRLDKNDVIRPMANCMKMQRTLIQFLFSVNVFSKPSFWYIMCDMSNI